MIRYKCTVSYNGRNYSGWQTQKKGNSIQEHIEHALTQLTHKKINITAAGRTDKGVNAQGQVFHFDTELEMTPRKWKGAINNFLPEDIHIIDVEEKDERFHARYSVKTKQYDYKINFGEYDVFSKDYAYQCPYQVDIKLMEKASKLFIGTHDFTSFNSNSLKETPDQVRTIENIIFKKDGDFLTISYIGRGFLRYMVRMLTAQLLDVGSGKQTIEELKEKFESKSKRVSRKNAPSEGLTLVKIDYFEVLALNNTYMIREYLPEDKL
ncbi:MAG: tRNA pseudouridine(38-40) synthase TruA, partial [Solobacterium sp.]|nr:tRNA pseudouridine(38-40) synthase TruA [Solobacterium sp.]